MDGGLPFSRRSVSQTSPARLPSELVLVAIFLSVLLALLLLCTRALAAATPIVRVMVDREPRGVLRIRGFDLTVSELPSGRAVLHESRQAIVDVTCSLGGQLKVEGRRVGGPVRIASQGGFLRVGSSQYRDDLYVYSFNGSCVVINHVDLEQYIAGVLDSEMSPKWNLQALMAQAIAARTYAIYQMREAGTPRFHGLEPPFDLASSVKDQVYEGAHRETYKSERAIQLTRGQVLTYDGRPIKAFYHSTCGGHTETPERVWGLRLPYFRSVGCDYCRASPRFNWLYSISAAELERKLKSQGLLRGRLLGLKILERNKLGRVTRVQIRGAEATIELAATRLRELVGGLNLRSTDFNIAHNPDGGAHGGDFVFLGHGSGHGVGMCQWGAKTMGDLGYDAREILTHYYPSAQITKMY
jgi:stage II sporulation protein D